jgi:hypothetical protein
MRPAVITVAYSNSSQHPDRVRQLAFFWQVAHPIKTLRSSGDFRMVTEPPSGRKIPRAKRLVLVLPDSSEPWWAKITPCFRSKEGVVGLTTNQPTNKKSPCSLQRRFNTKPIHLLQSSH